jgi:hypothetical protein
MRGVLHCRSCSERLPVRWAPKEATRKAFLAHAEVEMARLGAPSANLPRQFNIDRYFLDGCRDMVPMQIADEAVRPDPDITTGRRCAKRLGSDVENFIEDSAVGRCDVDGYSWCEGAIGADIGLSVENLDDGGAIVEMGVEVPPFIASAFRADALTVLKLGDFNRSDAKFLVVGRQIRQPEMAVLAALHALLLARR